MDALLKRVCAWTCRFLLLIVVTASAQEMPIPVQTQWSLLQKILSFQKKLDPADNRKPVLAIVYQSRLRMSLDARSELIEVIGESKPTLGGGAIRVVEVDLSQSGNISAQLAGSGATIMYVAPLRAVDIESITGVSRTMKILTFGSVPEYVEKGLSVGVDNRGGRPRILINRNAAMQEGSDFYSQLLRHVTIVE